MGWADVVRFRATSSGTGDFVVSSAITGYQTPASASASTGSIFSYRAESDDLTQWEVGTGTSTTTGSVTSIPRTTILFNSSGGTTAIAFTSAPQVALVELAEDWYKLVDALSYNGMQINGSCDVSQVNGTSAVTDPNGYVLDCWQVLQTGTMSITCQQVTDAPVGYSNSLKVTVATAESSIGASDFVVIQTRIEGYRVARLAFGNASASPISIGFWTKIHRTGTYSGAISNSAINRSYVFSFTQNVADTWEYKTITIPGDTTGTWLTTNGIGLSVIFAMAAGSSSVGSANSWQGATLRGVTGTTNGVAATSDIFQITGLIVLPGVELPSSARAPFVMRPFDQELMLCKRQYEKSYDHGVAPGTASQLAGLTGQVVASNTVPTSTSYGGRLYSVHKRASPTVTIYGYQGASGKVSNSSPTDIGGASSGVASGVSSAIGFNVINSSGSDVTTTANFVFYHWVADARL